MSRSALTAGLRHLSGKLAAQQHNEDSDEHAMGREQKGLKPQRPKGLKPQIDIAFCTLPSPKGLG